MTDPYPASAAPDDGGRKAAARLRARALRDAHGGAEDHAAVAAAVRRAILDAVALPDGPVGGYWPLGSELDVRPLLLHLVDHGRIAALPESGPRGQPLTFRHWDAGVPMRTGRYGIAEPDGTAAVVPAVLLVPLLAFDRTGHRLGYGAGYYDRTIAALRAAGPLLTIGVGFAAQEVERVPTGPHDEPLDWIVTERAAHRCGAHEWKDGRRT